MSDSRQDLPRQIGELARALEELGSELEPGDRPPLRPPTPRELTRFTSEVTIPAIVLALETNVRALKLLQRTLRLATEGPQAQEGAGTRTRERAEVAGRRTLAQLDSAFADLQDALAARPPDDRARQLLDEARSIQREIETQLAADAPETTRRKEVTGDQPDRDVVEVDVESELQSIKDDVEDGDQPNGEGE
jgi:small-conductance mechanosensitive channel